MSIVQQRPMTSREWGLLLLLSLVWGGSFFFVGVAVKELPPLTIVAARVTIAAALLWLTAPLTRLAPQRMLDYIAPLALMGLLNNAIPFVLIVSGQTRLASGLASILNASTPIFTVVAAHFLTENEKLNPRRLAGALFGLIGVATMMGADLARGMTTHLAAEFAILGAAVSYALASLYGRRFRSLGLTPIDVATGQVTASSLMLLPLALLVDRPWSLPAPSLAVIAAVVAIAALSTALGYIVYFRILAGAGATNVVLVTLLAPASSILLGALVLGEGLTPRHFLGLGIIAIGLGLIDGRLARTIEQRVARRLTPRSTSASASRD
jgi:drug/metabolite transporter (DMT)-like permease